MEFVWGWNIFSKISKETDAKGAEREILEERNIFRTFHTSPKSQLDSPINAVDKL